MSAKALRQSSDAAILDAPARISAGNDDLQHWYCDCDPDVSLCGRDLSEVEHEDFDEASCVVCEAMVDRTCPWCGE